MSAANSGVTVVNVENVNGSTGNDAITIGNTSGTATVTGGLGTDFITASAGDDVFRYTAPPTRVRRFARDTVNNFDAAHDRVRIRRSRHCEPRSISSAAACSTVRATPHVEAMLTNIGGLNVLQIDVNGDGVIGAGDMEIVLNGLTGTLTDANFSVVAAVNQRADRYRSVQRDCRRKQRERNVWWARSPIVDPDAGDTATYSLTDNAGGLFDDQRRQPGRHGRRSTSRPRLRSRSPSR